LSALALSPERDTVKLATVPFFTRVGAVTLRTGATIPSSLMIVPVAVAVPICSVGELMVTV